MVKSAARAGSGVAARAVASVITPWRASEVHDSRVRRIAATTPNIICPKNARCKPGATPSHDPPRCKRFGADYAPTIRVSAPDPTFAGRAPHESGREYPLRGSTGKSPD